MRKRLIVVGNGMAGLKFVEELTARAPGRFETVVVGAEPDAAYNRVLLSSLLAREIASVDTAMKPRSWYAEHGISLITGAPITKLDAEKREVRFANQRALPFDKLVLATGSDAIRLDMPGNTLNGVMTFRTLGDVARLEAAAGKGVKVAVIGGGLLGIEAAYGLSRAGADVTLVHLMDRLMERQLDAAAAELLKTAIEDRGIKVRLNAKSERIVGGRRVEGLQLADGDVIPADLVVMAVGITPNVALAKAAGLDVKRGIVVGDTLETSVPGIYAIGECAEHAGVCYGLVEPAYEHARVLARQLTGEDARYTGSVLATNLKVSGVPVFSAGDFEGAGAETLHFEDRAARTYRKLVIRNGRLSGAVLIGETADGLWYRDLIRAETPIAPIRNSLVFGRSFAEAA